MPNPSFEDTLANPVWNGILNNDCAVWYSPAPGSADYYNDLNPSCLSCPSNFLQVPRSGYAYAGFFAYDYNSPLNFRECIEIRLTDTLQPGKTYCVSFYLSLEDGANYGCNSIGALFTQNSIGSSANAVNFIPQVFNYSNVLDDSENWLLVNGSFIANGNEQYLTITNFSDDASSDTFLIPGGNQGWLFSYYYIDDVSVIECSDTTPTFYSILEVPNIFSPNADAINDLFEIKAIDIHTYSCKIYDRWGAKLFETTETDRHWDGRTESGVPCSDGTYFYVVEAIGMDGRIFSERGFVTVVR